jgi:hypothetical protein
VAGEVVDARFRAPYLGYVLVGSYPATIWQRTMREQERPAVLQIYGVAPPLSVRYDLLPRSKRIGFRGRETGAAIRWSMISSKVIPGRTRAGLSGTSRRTACSRPPNARGIEHAKSIGIWSTAD